MNGLKVCLLIHFLNSTKSKATIKVRNLTQLKSSLFTHKACVMQDIESMDAFLIRMLCTGDIPSFIFFLDMVRKYSGMFINKAVLVILQISCVSEKIRHITYL